MKNLNKVLAMLVVFMMVLSTVAFASSFSDVADTSSYSTAIEVGVDLGLFKGYADGTFAPEGEITRAEFAAIVVRLIGQEAQAEGAKSATQFIDVPADHWAAGYINIAVDRKVINGYGNGYFGPEDLVEYQDAITMMVRALGYEPAIGANSYPTGYLAKAGELGLTTGVNGTNGVAINRGAVAQIAFNALDVAIMTQSGYGTFTQYVINDGYSSTMGTTNVKKTLLSEGHSIVKVQAIIAESSDSVSTNVNAQPYVQVDVTNAMYNKFGINDRKMYVGDSDAMDYVGKKVIMFVEYDEFEDECTIKALYEVKGDVLVIDLADVVSITEITETEKYTEKVDGKDVEKEREVFVGLAVKYYITDSKTKTLTLSKNTSIYYNGVLGAMGTVGVDYEELVDLSGSIELSLLDNETADADYDTMFITAYDVFVVDEVRAAAGIVTSKIEPTTFANRIYFDEEDGDVKATLTDANGNAIEWTDLAEYDVLSVKYVDTGVKDIYEAKIIENTVTGTVDEISGDEDDRYVVINDVEYKVLPSAEDEKTIKLGDEGTYYLDDNDNVVYHNTTIAKSENYAYVISVKPADDMDPAQVKALTKENGIVVVDLASKITVTFEGEKTTNVSTKAEFDAEDYVGEVVTYKLNASGNINAIEIASTEKTAYYDYDYLLKNFAEVDLEDYDEDAASFKIDGKKYYIDETTVIFNVPFVENEDEELVQADDDDLEVVALKNLADGQTLVGADIYDVDEDRVIGVIALKEANEINPATDNATFVTKVSSAYDENGVDVTRVTGYVGLQEVSYITDADIDEEDILGMLVIPTYYANGDVKSFTLVEDVDNEALELKGYAGELLPLDLNDDKKLDSPVVTKSKLIYLGADDANEFKVPTTANIYVYDATSTMRNKHTVGVALGYIDYDEELGLYIDDDDTDNNVMVYIYEVEGDVVDVLYYIYDAE